MRAEDCARLLGANDNGVVAKHHHHRPPRWLVAAGFTTGTGLPRISAAQPTGRSLAAAIPPHPVSASRQASRHMVPPPTDF